MYLHVRVGGIIVIFKFYVIFLQGSIFDFFPQESCANEKEVNEQLAQEIVFLKQVSNDYENMRLVFTSSVW